MYVIVPTTNPNYYLVLGGYNLHLYSSNEVAINSNTTTSQCTSWWITALHRLVMPVRSTHHCKIKLIPKHG